MAELNNNSELDTWAKPLRNPTTLKIRGTQSYGGQVGRQARGRRPIRGAFENNHYIHSYF